MKYYTLIFFSVFLLFSSPSQGQDDRLGAIRRKLDLLAQADPAYEAEVDLSVSSMPLGDLLRNVAKSSSVSISFKGGSDVTVNSYLNRARIVDLIYFLCQQYDLDVDIVGNIVSVFPYRPPQPEIPGPTVTFHPDSTRSLSYDLRNVPLEEASRLVADASGINLIVPQQLAGRRVSGYAVRLPVDEAIHAFADANNLEVFKNGAVWNIEPKTVAPQEGAPSWNRPRELSGEQLTIDSTGLITVQIQHGNITDIIYNLCERLGLNYYFISPVDGQASLYLKNVELETLLKVLFTGTSFSYYKEEGIYMFGISQQDAMASAQVVHMQNRTISRIMEVIPPDLKVGVQVQPFGDLNSIVLSGDQRQVARVEQFLKSIDKTVPLITIEVIIVDASKSRKDEAGISLGIGNAPATTGGTLSPGINMNLGASDINNLLNSFNGFGAINLGKVNANFYANLQFLEGTGNIELRSTPKLSTLNGHPAELTSGERRFYKEVSESLMGSQNPIQTSSYTWKSIDANLTVKIVPFVSGNDEITLEIEIEQSEFTPKEEDTAPPGTLTRKFLSEIRVQNEEMVLLGGIERNERTKTSSGLPLIARIPVLKWIFGKTVDNKEERKLNVFIKPTVIH